MFQQPLFKIPFRYGIIGGIIAGIVIVSLYYLGRHPFLLPWIVDFRIVIFSVFIFLCLKEVRDLHQNGNLFFWQGMIGSYVFIGTSGFLGAVVSWCLATWDAGFLPSYISGMQQQLLNFKKDIVDGMGQAAYDMQVAELPATSALDLASDYFLKSLIIGLFLTIIISVVLRKQTQTQTQ